MKIHAPGKLFWIGEYAVLEGAPAVVTAVNKGAYFHKKKANKTTLTFTSSLFQKEFIARNSKGEFTNDDRPQTALIRAVLTVLDEKKVLRKDGLKIEIDTLALSGQNSKFGLGSSGAVAAGLTSILAKKSCSKKQIVTLALEAHHRFQGKIGSGADVYASLYGGILKMENGQCSKIKTHLKMETAVIYTGFSASTPKMVRAIRVWKKNNTFQANTLFTQLKACASAGVHALEKANIQAWLEAVKQYAKLEQAITNASGVPIINKAVQSAMDLAHQYGYVAKPSGAGGGDIVVAFADPTQIDSVFTQKQVPKNSNLTLLPLSIESSGVLDQIYS